MRELGIDLSDRRPQRLTRELAEQADVVVTMGCGDACPFIPGKRYIDWELARPQRHARSTRSARPATTSTVRVADLLTELETGVASGS